MSLLSKVEITSIAENLFESSYERALSDILKPRRVVDSDHTYVYMKRFYNVGEFHVRVGETLIRVFNMSTMPKKLKEVLAMIHSISWPCHGPMQESPSMSRPEYVPEHFVDIGWMTSKTEYVLCLSNDFLDELQGKSVSNDTVEGTK